MRINGEIATKEQELEVWKEQLNEAREAHNISFIKLAFEKVKTLESEARIERIMKKLEG